MKPQSNLLREIRTMALLIALSMKQARTKDYRQLMHVAR